MKQLCSGLLLTLALSGCAGYIMHPGAVSVTESKIYDVVNDARNTIAIATPQLASGVLPVRFKPLLNDIITAYNLAFPALNAYDSAVRAGLPSDALLAKLNTAKVVLQTAMTAYKGAR
jgi:hypothetical protein